MNGGSNKWMTVHTMTVAWRAIGLPHQTKTLVVCKSTGIKHLINSPPAYLVPSLVAVPVAFVMFVSRSTKRLINSGKTVSMSRFSVITTFKDCRHFMISPILSSSPGRRNSSWVSAIADYLSNTTILLKSNLYICFSKYVELIHDFPGKTGTTSRDT